MTHAPIPQRAAHAPGGGDIAYEITGQGPPLLLLHGAEGTRRMFDALVGNLQAQFTCIGFDQRGCGESATPPVDCSPDDIADDAAWLLEQLGFASAHVYGTSFGGIVAQSLAARHPQRVCKLVLGSTWAAGALLADIHPAAARTLAVLREDRPRHAAAIARYFYPDAYLAAHPAVAARFGAVPSDGTMHRLRARCVATRSAADPSAIAAPTLVVAGAGDRLAPPDTTLALAARIPGAVSCVLTDAGHLPSLQQPAELAAAISAFLGDANASKTLTNPKETVHAHP